LVPPIKPERRPCEGCSRHGIQTWHCALCDTDLCDECWPGERAHRPGKTGPDGLPHEKADLGIVLRLSDILTPPKDAREQHLYDQDSAWFGVERDESDAPVFCDYGQYASIIGNSSTGEFKTRYPRLVSFIGQTGAGKSTLVKMLIDQQVRKIDPTWELIAPSPVVGSPRNDHSPTSGDVHLYADPSTSQGQFPMLYADCEGLEGGEALPVSAQLCASSGGSRKRSESSSFKRHAGVAKLARGTQHTIFWADTPETRKRQYAVSELYPRLLYTFSDTIVFVLRNAK
jgi:energy-coupling factor transporter ATP-binding protein EcfA2